MADRALGTGPSGAGAVAAEQATGADGVMTVITTISPLTRGIRRLLDVHGGQVLLVGDRKTPAIESDERLAFLPFDEQSELGFELAAKLPADHYARKNIGYLYAIRQGAGSLYETDDDNLPADDWRLYPFTCEAICEPGERFVNAYRYFTAETIWPRGYPLHHITRPEEPCRVRGRSIAIGVWSGLVDRDPDVDAIWRLTRGEDLFFEKTAPVALPAHSYCPFNSQNTLWQRERLPLLYLPATVSIRFTDILRGYVAQRLLWDAGLHLGFHAPTMYQIRNDHDLMRDFRDELVCYLEMDDLVAVLEACPTGGDPLEDLPRVYMELAGEGLVGEEEPSLCAAWVRDVEKIWEPR